MDNGKCTSPKSENYGRPWAEISAERLRKLEDFSAMLDSADEPQDIQPEALL